MTQLPLKLVIYGPPRVKKNNQRVSCRGRYPKKYNTKAYNAWRKSAIEQIERFMLIHKISEPIDRPLNIQYHFYMKTKQVVDLSALYEGVNDEMVGLKMLTDDNYRVIAGHDGSRVFVDKNSPRMELTISDM